jgi:hypothetical protein
MISELTSPRLRERERAANVTNTHSHIQTNFLRARHLPDRVIK